jgi:glycosyltransferase involved in cell wall biosynthesis
MAAQIFVHGPAAAQLVSSEFLAAGGKLTEIWHGHWIDHYPRGCTKGAARLKLDVPVDAYVYVFVGTCKEYKNLQRLIPTFQSMAGTAWLVIAGRFQSEKYQHQIESLVAQKSARIRLFREYIPDAELQYYLAAADIVVLPYAEILTSRSAMPAFSFGRPVIAPRRGFLEDVIVSKVGLLYDPRDP